MDTCDRQLHPPNASSPKSTLCLSADLATRITPCQFGGQPVCSERWYLASAGMTAIGRHKLACIVTVADVFPMSRRLGERRFPATVPAARRKSAKMAS
jgi:hypothetical protein